MNGHKLEEHEKTMSHFRRIAPSCFSAMVVVLLSGCETAIVVCGRTFGTDQPDLVGARVVPEGEVDSPPENVWVLQDVRYLADLNSEEFSDGNGRFEFTRIVPVLWLIL